MIRKIEKKDEKEFLSLNKEFYHSQAVLHTIPLENAQKAFQEAMAQSPYLDIFMIEEEEKIIGYFLTARTFSLEGGGLTIWIEELYIQKEYQGKGIGKKALDFLFSYYPAKRFRLEISPSNQSIENLYQKKGFIVCPYIQMMKE